MKIKKILIAVLLSCCALTSCTSSPLKKYKRNGQYEEIEYEEFAEKRINKDSFVFFIRQEICSSCSNYYPVVANVLASNENYKIFSMDVDEIETVYRMVLLANINEVLGSEYLENNGYSTDQIYTPLTGLVVNGNFEMLDIGVINEDQLTNYYNHNLITFKSFKEFTRRTAANQSFVLFGSNEATDEYQKELRNYFNSQSDKQGYFMNSNILSSDNKTKLINRINYFLDEDITELPQEYVLTYKNGAIVDYKSIKCTTEDLNNIYAK